MSDPVLEQGKIHAQQLAYIVRTYGRDSVASMLDGLDRNSLMAMSVVLAAALDIDRPLSEMIAWIDEPVERRTVIRRGPLAPCGTHAAFTRHKARGEAVDALCLGAEREYQRDRKRISRGIA